MSFALTLAAAVALAAPAAEPPPRDTPADKAVQRGLAFLANAQNRDGSWSGHGGRNIAVTGLAVMAFLSAGHVPGEGKYGEVVEKGVRWVLKEQQPNGLMANEGGHEMYHHGIATLMLAEAAGMTDGPLGDELRRRLEKAVALILKAQRGGSASERGGWRYQVAHVNGSDISVTGWQVMALRAAKNLGCDVPATAVDRAVDFIWRCQDPGTGGFRYMPSANVTAACTGTSILALELCGKEQHGRPELLRAGAYLVRENNLPHWGRSQFFYSVYYGAQASFQLGGNYWDVYRARLHEVLLKNQDAGGSWGSGGFIGDSLYGAAYCTSMAVLALTVEYRYLPIYQRGEEPAAARE
jgi:hypothetical protein